MQVRMLQVAGLVVTVCWIQVVLFQSECSATNVFQVVGITQAVEKSVTVRWNSETNAMYRIEHANVLSTNTQWSVLYENYPSQGTSTFWADTGDYLAIPEVLHPSRVSTRFCRVVKTGTNSIAPPQVFVTWPTNGVVLETNVVVSVSATGTTPIASIRLFVDGEEVDDGDPESTNFVVNTCEWSNGPHTIFAVAGSTTTLPSAPEVSADVRPAFAASPIVSVTFSNYVSRFFFSEPFFEPELGQTQNISAVFATNSNWTLTITDSSGTTNRTATGTGATMSFAWDGKGDGGASLSNDVYDFTLTATSVGSLLASSSGGTATSPLTKAKKVKR